jgi:hypothetical protein
LHFLPTAQRRAFRGLSRDPANNGEPFTLV